MNKTADTILDDILVHDEGCPTNFTDDYLECECTCRGEKKQLKQALLNDILALVGEDGVLRRPARYEVAPGTKYFEVPDKATHYANDIRWELRQKICQYFGQDNQGGKT